MARQLEQRCGSCAEGDHDRCAGPVCACTCLQPRWGREDASRANRAGDSQPLPVTNDLPRVHDLVVADMERRLAVGIERYGTPLQPNNGRDALRDAYEEVLDLAMYLRQRLYEQDGK